MPAINTLTKILTKWVRKTDSCWLWVGLKNKQGYGFITIDSHLYYAHRYIYQEIKKENINGKQLHHTCHNKRCVNPDHLQKVTPRQHATIHAIENMEKLYCKYGHELSPENTGLYKGKKYCRKCKRAIWHVWKDRRKRRESK